ncbi:hypothetical protein B9479_000108 [Cryptococcus floricola]|uniref:Cytochrome P450 n=1 Tax=Cryptococcus floricola TaxID=2591691 RepID=A0A5D3B8W2_9TREE|nr:hypothetical protein B9479_000108 [Cryptococcus floricola]
MPLPSLFGALFPAFHLHSCAHIALSLLALIAATLFAAYLYAYPIRLARLRFYNLPGPEPESFLWGSLPTLLKSGPNVPQGEWAAKYGHTIRYRLHLGAQRFMTLDATGLNYILSHPDVFPKPDVTRRALADMLGNGLLTSEGEDHKRQRRALNPSFSVGAIKDMVPTFYDKAYELQAKLLALVQNDDPSERASPTPAKEEDFVPGGKKIDVMRYLGKTTLDVIGVTGFGYDFKTLSEPNNALSDAYAQMFTAGMNINFKDFVLNRIPLIRHFPTEKSRIIASSRKITRDIGAKLVKDKKEAVMASFGDDLEKGQDIGKDLLSILIKANMAADLKPEQRLTDEEVLNQITTFMLAGNETSSTGLSWTLYNLSLNMDVQAKLREEVMSIPDERPDVETLNSLTYMDAVLREALRLCPPAPGTIRQAKEDVVIPLGVPLKGRDGTMMESVGINKGTMVFIPIANVNCSEAIWGPNASKFDPTRFLSSSAEVKPTHVPGVWGNLLTFLGGTRNCIGYRFALAEMKAILFVLMKNFEFQELKSKPEVEKKSAVVMRCRIKGEEDAGLQMPLMVVPLEAV